MTWQLRRREGLKRDEGENAIAIDNTEKNARRRGPLKREIMIEAAIFYKERIVFDSSIVMLFVDDYGGSLLSSSCELIFLVHGQGQTNKLSLGSNVVEA